MTVALLHEGMDVVMADECVPREGHLPLAGWQDVFAHLQRPAAIVINSTERRSYDGEWRNGQRHGRGRRECGLRLYPFRAISQRQVHNGKPPIEEWLVRGLGSLEGHRTGNRGIQGQSEI